MQERDCVDSEVWSPEALIGNTPPTCRSGDLNESHLWPRHLRIKISDRSGGTEGTQLAWNHTPKAQEQDLKQGWLLRALFYHLYQLPSLK